MSQVAVVQRNLKRGLLITGIVTACGVGAIGWKMRASSLNSNDKQLTDDSNTNRVLYRRLRGSVDESDWHEVPIDEIPDKFKEQPTMVQRLKALPTPVKITIFGGLTGVFLLFNAFVIPFLMPARKALGKVPFLPTDLLSVRSALQALPFKGSGRKFVDLGSGDGRNVVEAALFGYASRGIEMNPWLRKLSERSAKKEGVTATTSFVNGNYWEHDISDCDVIMIYGLDANGVMDRMKEKMVKEARPDSYLLSTIYKVPGWIPEKYEWEGTTEVHVYKNQ